MTSTRALAASLLLLVSLALSACAGGAAPTPTATPMSVEAAGEYYLDTVCPAQGVGTALGAAFDAQDLDAFTAAAEVARDAYKEASVRFSDPNVVWPDSVAGNIIVLRDASIALATSYESLSQVTSFEQANEIVFPDAADSSAASVAIRDALALSSDPAVSCPE